MTEKKITKKTMFTKVLEIIESAEVENKELYTKFINHEIELLEKKSSNRKLTAQQEDNKILLETISTILEIARNTENQWLTIAEIQSKSPTLKEYNDKPVTNQRISALLKKLIESGEVERKEEKRKAVFRKVAETEE